MNLLKEVEARRSYCIDLRRWFHRHPELSLKEYNTSKRIEEELDKLGIEHSRVGETGIYAVIKGKKGEGKVLGIRADMDALPIQEVKNREYHSENEGISHACGHDGHTASLLTTAAVIKEHENDFAGEVRLFFQQAEEIGAGGRLFVAAGLMNGVERVIGYHGSSLLEVGQVSCTPGPNNASCDFFRITVKGESAHVSTPQKGIDALYISSLIVSGLQGIVARNTDPFDNVVVGIGKLVAGTAYNIIADEAVIEGTTRCFTDEIRKKTNGLVERYAKGIAEAYGATAEVEFKNFANPLINGETGSVEAARCAEKIIGKENVVTDFPKALGADDMADFLREAEGCYMYVGTRSKDNPDTASPQHSITFDIGEDSMLIASSIIVTYFKEFFRVE